MRPGVYALCLLLLWAAHLRSAVLRLRGPVEAGPPHEARDAFAIEVGADETTPAGIACAKGAPGHGTLTVGHRLLTGGALEPSLMSERDWEALPQVGPHRASALTSAFARGTAGDARTTLARVRLPASVRRDLEGRLGLDEGSSRDICSLGSWPTRLSGYARPR